VCLADKGSIPLNGNRTNNYNLNKKNNINNSEILKLRKSKITIPTAIISRG
jgi:hypothetical protein